MPEAAGGERARLAERGRAGLTARRQGALASHRLASRPLTHPVHDALDVPGQARIRATPPGPATRRPPGKAAIRAIRGGGRVSGPGGQGPDRRPRRRVVRTLLLATAMKETNLIAVRQLRVGEALITVEIFRNAGNSVAARCVLGASDTPIIDAPNAEEALATVADALEGLLLARRRKAEQPLAA